MRLGRSALVIPALLGLSASQAHAQLVINPTFGSSITTNANAVTIESTIDSAIQVYEQRFTNPITVNIDFEKMTSGLGQSSTHFGAVTFADYRQALINDKQEHDTAFLSTLPAANDPTYVNDSVSLTTADLRALGFNNLGTPVEDSTISINTGDTNLSRTGPQDGSKYDLSAVVSHEIDEALGLSSVLDNHSAADPPPADTLGSLDLFRYSSPGVRSLTTQSSATAYFSIDNGQTKIVSFNQTGGGSDFQDFASSSTPRVQDAYGTPGVDLNLGPAEFTALQVVGYNLAPTPEPSQTIALGLGILALAGLSLKARKRNANAD